MTGRKYDDPGRIQMLVSRDNQRIKHIRQLLNNKKKRKAEGLFVIEGIKPVTEAFKEGLAEDIYVSEDYEGETPDGSFIVGAGLFKEITDTVTPQGILAVVRVPVFDKDLIYGKEKCRLICLEDVRDPGNVGTIIRTAEAAGFDAVVLSAGCADVYQPKVVRSTMGSILRVPCFVCRDESKDDQDLYGRQGFSYEMTVLKQHGFDIYAAHLAGAVDYREIRYPQKMAILIGNEANGLTDASLQCSDAAVKIPMHGRVESLNASIAAAILMFSDSRE